MIALALATAVTAVGSWLVAAACGLRRTVLVVLAALLLFLSQIVLLVLAVGGALRQLNPNALTTGALVVAAAECYVVARFRRSVAWEGTAGVARSLTSSAARAWRHPGVALLGLAVVAEYTWRAVLAATVPDGSYESLAYHLLGPDSWIQAGRIVHSPQNLFSDVYPQDHEAITAWTGTFLHNVSYAGFTPFAFAGLGAVTIAALARLLGVRRSWSALAGLGFLLVPNVLAQLGTSYNDIGAATTVLACLTLLYALADETQVRDGRLVGLIPVVALAGVAAGLAAGIKADGLVLLPVGLIFAVVQHFRLADRAGINPVQLRPRLWLTATAVTLPAFPLAAFWYIRTWVTYGNPFYPVTVLGFIGEGSQSQVIIGANKPAALDHVPFGPLGAAIRSWTEDLHGHLVSYDQRLGGFGPQWLWILFPALVVAIVLLVRHRRDALAGVVVPVVAVCLASGAAWWARYTFALVALGCVAFAYVLEHTSAWAARQVRRWGLAARAISPVAVTAFVALSTLGSWWATDPSDITVVMGAYAGPASLSQLADLITSPDPEAEVTPWNGFAAVEDLPAGTTIGVPATDHEYMLQPFVGNNLAHRLVILYDQPDTTATQLAAMAVAHDVDYVAIDATAPVQLTGAVRGKPKPSVSESVATDLTQFKPLTGYTVGDGAMLYEVGQYRECGSPTLGPPTVHTALDGMVTVTDRMTSPCPIPVGTTVDVWRGDTDSPLWHGTDVPVAALRTSAGGRVSYDLSPPDADVRLFFRIATQWVGEDIEKPAASAPVYLVPAMQPAMHAAIHPAVHPPLTNSLTNGE
jgi:hypothetical protein